MSRDIAGHQRTYLAPRYASLWRETAESMRGPYTSGNTNLRRMNLMSNRITSDPAICHGKPCIRGLRYPVESVLEWLAGGMTIEEVLADYPDLEREDILAALAYAARLAHVNRAEPLTA